MPDRSSDNDKRALIEEMPDPAERARLAADVRYRGYGKHKRNPYIWKVAAYHGDAEDSTYCEDAGLLPADLSRALRVIRRGISAGLFGDQIDGDNPTILWTIDDDGWIFELRLTNRDQAEYHGYPVRLNDAMARRVIIRFGDWLRLREPAPFAADERDHRALQAAQSLYS